MSVKLVIDSASDISQEESSRLGVVMIPMEVRIGHDNFLDGVNLTPGQLYNELIESCELPKTSQINPYRLEEEFEKITSCGDEVKLIGKAMGSKKGNNLLTSLVEKKGGIDFDMPYGVVWSGTDDSVLKKYVEDSGHLWENHTDSVPAYMIGSTIGTHIGPGAIGVAFFEK